MGAPRKTTKAKKTAKPRNPVKKTGRPTKYKEEFVEQGAKLTRMGATDAQLADFFKVTLSTLYLWKVQHQAFSDALKRGKEEIDAQVEQSLFRRAMGYTHDSEKVFQFKEGVIRAPTQEHYPPDVTAMIFWLKNRQPEKWRDRPDVAGDEAPPTPVKVSIEVRDARRGGD
ncbi:MAG: hypothetical protein GAK28_00135 [Luteibacter sp.]|uniref:hypothetical protein n=1 Tax=Luteibacter sp. TaxID=1886636 RepID=UPI001384117B|nr:hypothetical protein [Luteibacter sp.]KAF1009497.1 MAG: hypothetical protein GAK28_00135 [Luteibacter sp.]